MSTKTFEIVSALNSRKLELMSLGEITGDEKQLIKTLELINCNLPDDCEYFHYITKLPE